MINDHDGLATPNDGELNGRKKESSRPTTRLEESSQAH
eukprot:CAMPEP_0119573668 /NCGR_PEP_ID=MMETSP1352-20130426/45241_1 /TAXON_ID=265584 /ORGANISM="Stauroneis constricta, Strain CCMP1120" /LENGTH=37 /DNA_ID= /DNA_START= /DNA_END= /DNA_ORIENTATION=